MGTAQTVNVDIILTPDANEPNGIRFEMDSSFKKGSELTFKNNNKGDWFEVDFNIVDKGKTGYLFPDDCKKAMYVKPVTDVSEACPDDWNCPEFWPQFAATNVTNNNRRLHVKNLNETVQLYKFCLWFTKTPEANGPCIPFDPIGSNQNAGAGATSISTTTAAIITIAVIALVVIASYRYWAM